MKKRSGSTDSGGRMKHVAEAVVWLAVLFLIAICLGEPDILDGWIKRANDCAADKSTVSNK